MARKDTIQTPPMPNEWAMPITWLKWFYDLYLLVTGREGRQNFINTLTDSKNNTFGVRTFFTNKPNGDAEFYDAGTTFPYIGTSDELIVPSTVVASRRTILNVGALRVYQNIPQGVSDTTDTIMTFHAKEFDQDSAFDLTTSKWTPIQAGKYSVTAQVAYAATNVVVGKFIRIYLSKNGIDYAASQVTTAAAEDSSVTVTGLLDMNGTTDYMYVVIEHNFGAVTNTFGDNFACYLVAHKVD